MKQKLLTIAKVELTVTIIHNNDMVVIKRAYAFD